MVLISTCQGINPSISMGRLLINEQSQPALNHQGVEFPAQKEEVPGRLKPLHHSWPMWWILSFKIECWNSVAHHKIWKKSKFWILCSASSLYSLPFASSYYVDVTQWSLLSKGQGRHARKKHRTSGMRPSLRLCLVSSLMVLHWSKFCQLQNYCSALNGKQSALLLMRAHWDACQYQRQDAPAFHQKS